MIDDTLFFSTATGQDIRARCGARHAALALRCGVDPGRDYSEMASRGVSYWRDRRMPPPLVRWLRERIVFATIDARLFAIDAKTGKRCADFGDNGEVALSKGVRWSTPARRTIR